MIFVFLFFIANVKAFSSFSTSPWIIRLSYSFVWSWLIWMFDVCRNMFASWRHPVSCIARMVFSSAGKMVVEIAQLSLNRWSRLKALFKIIFKKCGFLIIASEYSWILWQPLQVCIVLFVTFNAAPTPLIFSFYMNIHSIMCVGSEAETTRDWIKICRCKLKT